MMLINQELTMMECHLNMLIANCKNRDIKISLCKAKKEIIRALDISFDAGE